MTCPTSRPGSSPLVEEARRRCLAIETGARPDRTERDPVPTFAEFVAGPMRVRFDQCKPSTKRSARSALRARLLPAFASLPLDRITRAVVTRWFDEYSQTAPDGANSALSLLRRILNHAIDCGHLQVNPARGVKPNHRPKLTRFLSRGELRRLQGGAAMGVSQCAGPRHPGAAAEIGKRLRLSFAPRSGPRAVLKSAALVLGTQEGRDRGRTST